MFLLPTCCTKFYRFDGAWKKLYSEDFTVDEKKAIIAALDRAVRQAGYTAEKHWASRLKTGTVKSRSRLWASRRRWTKRKNGIPTSPSTGR